MVLLNFHVWGEVHAPLYKFQVQVTSLCGVCVCVCVCVTCTLVQVTSSKFQAHGFSKASLCIGEIHCHQVPIPLVSYLQCSAMFVVCDLCRGDTSELQGVSKET